MGKILELKQNNFLAGAINDPRATTPGGFWYSENLEVGKRKSLKQVVNNQANNCNGFIDESCVTKLIQVGDAIYGYGQNNITDKHTAIWSKTTALNGGWSMAAYVDGTTNINKYDPFFVYEATGGVGYIYFIVGNSNLAKVKVSDWTLTANYITGTVLTLQGGLIWNGKIYGWYGQTIYALNTGAGTLTSVNTATPLSQGIVDIIPYQGKLLVICSSSQEECKAYLWDGITSTTFTQEVPIGMGRVFGAAILEGQVMVTLAARNRRSFAFMTFNGLYFKPLYTYNARENQAGTYAYITPCSKLKSYKGYLYTMVTGTKPDGAYAGYYEYFLARIGRENASNPIAFSIYKTFDFTTVTRSLDGQLIYNDFLSIETLSGAIATVPERSIAAVIHSDTDKSTFFFGSDGVVTAQSGVLETLKKDGSEYGLDASIPKSLKSVSVQFAPLPSGGSVTVKYRINEELTWTTIFTHTTANSTEHSAVNIESTGANLPDFYEIQFRIEVVGGAEILGWKAKFEPMEQSNY